MKTARFALMLATVISFAVDAAEAQDAPPPATMYPYSVFNKNPLSVGSLVWVNLGDTDCAWGLGWDGYPKATDECFAEYYRARIVKIFTEVFILNTGSVKYWIYRVEFESWTGQTAGRNAGFDDLFEVYNLPGQWAEYSTYFLRLNW